MPSYVRSGSLPHKRHIQFRRPDGGLYAEELFSTKGFESVYSLLYHLRPPTATLDVRPWKRPEVRFVENAELRNRHFKTHHLEAAGRDAIETRMPLLGNSDIVLSVAQADVPMQYFYRNAGGDELLFIHHGAGVIETQFGELAYRQHDYIIVPTGTTYRVVPSAPTRMLVHESNGMVKIPRKYRNEFGQLEEHAPYYERDFRVPVLKAPIDAPGEYEVRVNSGPRNATYIVQNHPFDVVGWDGYCYPYAFNVEEFMPITGKLHQPPPAHATFEAPGAAFCAFVPRLFDYHPLAVPVPYNHSSVDCDEVLYYVSGNFMSRRGVEEGSITLHAAGAPHGPQPGAVESSLGKTSTDEIAVMVDTFKPLLVAQAALDCEDPNYFRSWIESAGDDVIVAACPAQPVQMVKAAPAAYPNSATLSDDLVVRIDVTVNADGTVKSVRVTHTSGQTDADKAALAAARGSRYRAASTNCTAVPGHYAFTATFVAPVQKANGLPPGG